MDDPNKLSDAGLFDIVEAVTLNDEDSFVAFYYDGVGKVLETSSWVESVCVRRLLRSWSRV